jgi:hypothetical protein
MTSTASIAIRTDVVQILLIFEPIITIAFIMAIVIDKHVALGVYCVIDRSCWFAALLLNNGRLGRREIRRGNGRGPSTVCTRIANAFAATAAMLFVGERKGRFEHIGYE